MARRSSDMRPDTCLQTIGAEHAEAMYRWLSDQNLTAALGIHREVSLEETRRWIDAADSDPATHAFAVIEAGRHVGNVVLDQHDRHLLTIRLSIYLGDASERGRGLGERAMELALNHAFQQLGVFKVWLIVHAENEPALALYERCGFEREGVLRGEFMLGNRRLDAIRLAAFADGGGRR